MDVLTVRLVCPVCDHEQNMPPDVARELAGALLAAADDMPRLVFDDNREKVQG